jgi:hypothetical protein
MAYVSKENKAEKAPRLRALAKQFGLKATVARRHHSTLVLNIQQGSIDFIGNYMQATEGKREVESLGRHLTYLGVNSYWFHEHFTGKALEFLTAAMEIMNEGNHDRSDGQTDYFDIGWYCDINIGHWNKPYVLVD